MERRDFLRLSTCLLAGGIPLDILEASQNYRILKGDTLSAIAKKFGTTVAKLKQLNSLKSDRILVGQSLKVRETVRSTLQASTVSEIAKAPSTAPSGNMSLFTTARRLKEALRAFIRHI